MALPNSALAVETYKLPSIEVLPNGTATVPVTGGPSGTLSQVVFGPTLTFLPIVFPGGKDIYFTYPVSAIPSMLLHIQVSPNRDFSSPAYDMSATNGAGIISASKIPAAGGTIYIRSRWDQYQNNAGWSGTAIISVAPKATSLAAPAPTQGNGDVLVPGGGGTSSPGVETPPVIVAPVPYNPNPVPVPVLPPASSGSSDIVAPGLVFDSGAAPSNSIGYTFVPVSTIPRTNPLLIEVSTTKDFSTVFSKFNATNSGDGILVSNLPYPGTYYFRTQYPMVTSSDGGTIGASQYSPVSQLTILAPAATTPTGTGTVIESGSSTPTTTETGTAMQVADTTKTFLIAMGVLILIVILTR